MSNLVKQKLHQCSFTIRAVYYGAKGVLPSWDNGEHDPLASIVWIASLRAGETSAYPGSARTRIVPECQEHSRTTMGSPGKNTS